MKKILLMALLATATLTTFTSCTKEETTTPAATDVRDQALGNYNVTVQGYVLNSDGSLTQQGPLNNAGVLSIEKGQSNTILFNENGVTAMTGLKIAKASNGFTFDVSSFTSDNLTFTGYNGVTLGSVKYNGYYNSDDKTVVFYVQTNNGQQIVLRYAGTKK